MADQAVKVVRETRRDAGRDSFPIANGVTVYEGMFASIESGYLNHWADGANDVFLGLVLGGDDRAKDGALTGATSDAVPPEARVDTSGCILMHLASVAGQSTLTQTSLGAPVYCSTSNPDDLTTVSSGHTNPVGFICRFRSATDIDVKLFSWGEFMAQRIA